MYASMQPAGTNIWRRFRHESKKVSLIAGGVVALNVTEESPMQSAKDQLPKDVRLLGNSTLARLGHLVNDM